MNDLASLAKAVATIFPNQVTESGHEVQTHRVETTTDPKRPNELDVVIVQVFPAPAKRNEVTIVANGEALSCHPKTATDSATAQLVAFRLQSAAIGAHGPAITASRNESGLFAHAFRMTQEAPVQVESRARKPKDPTPQEASQ